MLLASSLLSLICVPLLRGLLCLIFIGCNISNPKDYNHIGGNGYTIIMYSKYDHLREPIWICENGTLDTLKREYTCNVYYNGYIKGE